jgi:HSP20 family protein
MKNSLVRYTSPSFLNLHRDEALSSLDRMFDHIFEDMFPSVSKEWGADLFSKGSYPKVNVLDQEDKVVIEAEIPGLTKEQVAVEVQDGFITIKGQKKTNTKDNSNKNNTYVYRELKRSEFSRSFQLNDNLDANKIDAKFENGMLEIIIPKKVVEPKIDEVKKIPIK